jgi:hypothetical protein
MEAQLAALVGAVAGGLFSYAFAARVTTVTVRAQRHGEARAHGIIRPRQALGDLAMAELDGNLPNLEHKGKDLVADLARLKSDMSKDDRHRIENLSRDLVGSAWARVIAEVPGKPGENEYAKRATAYVVLQVQQNRLRSEALSERGLWAIAMTADASAALTKVEVLQTKLLDAIEALSG